MELRDFIDDLIQKGKCDPSQEFCAMLEELIPDGKECRDENQTKCRFWENKRCMVFDEPCNGKKNQYCINNKYLGVKPNMK